MTAYDSAGVMQSRRVGNAQNDLGVTCRLALAGLPAR